MALASCAQLSADVQQDAATAAMIDPEHAACYQNLGEIAGDLAQGGGILTAIAVKERGRSVLVGSCAAITADLAITILKLKGTAIPGLPIGVP